VETVTIGGSTLGYSRTSRKVNATIPKIISINENTIDNTGLLIDVALRLI
jgi:hypothetical protein